MRAMIVTCGALVLAGPAAGAPGDPALTTELVVSGLSSPLLVTHAPGDFVRLFILERAGRVRVVRNGILLPTPFLDIVSLVRTSSEGGLLGLAFHPQYADNGRFYLDYTGPDGSGLKTIIAEYRVSPTNPDLAEPESARLVTEIPQPAPNHNAGWIGFGPNDGYLYLPLGDGGGSGGARAQQPVGQPLGKILRIDVNGDDFPSDPIRNYAIPPGNPFVGVVGDDETWALGMRNPWRCGFDRDTGDLWLGDVGAGALEEIDFQPSTSTGGENYGWGCMEGTQCNGSACTCNGPDLTLPVHEYVHTLGCAIVGGTVYRGCAIPDLGGTYFFGDWCTGRIWSFRYDGASVLEFRERTSELDPPGPVAIGNVTCFGEDAYGEMYVSDMAGQIFRIIPVDPPPDVNNNGIPDTCECLADVSGDGTVNVFDLLAVLAAWGQAGVPADVNGDGTVNVFDVLAVLAAWGPCGE